MLWFRKTARPRPVVRTRLRLESLDGRFAPSGLFDGDAPGHHTTTQFTPPAVVPPRIIDFQGIPTAPGWYTFTGRVVDSATVGGLTIDFGGVPSLQPESCVTNADGTFSHTVRVLTNGDDHGTVTAQTLADGELSNLAEFEIDP